jgi:putative sigma-54 modulation protein
MAKPTKSDTQGYNISVVSKHIQITDAIRDYVFEKLNKIEHFASHIIDVAVTLDAQKLEYSCTIMMNFMHFHIKVSANTDNMYSAIDKASDRLIKLVRRYKTRLQSTRAKHLADVDMHVNVIQPLHNELAVVNDEIIAENALREEERYSLHKIVAKETISMKMLTQDEAVMKMELSNDPFLIYRSEEDQKIKVMYRREDQNYALVQVQ